MTSLRGSGSINSPAVEYGPDETEAGGAVDLSVLVVNWNTRDLLRDCLESVSARVRDARIELVVVDNGSRDGSVELLRQEYPWVVRIENEDNRGFAAGVNQAISASHGRYVLLLNSDARLVDDAIVTIV